MPIDSGNLALKGLDDLFSTEENRQEEQREQVQQIPIDALHPFTNHPFKVLDDEAMTRTVESIAQYGVLAPLIARPRPDGDGYEIISGHRRQYAAKLAGLDTLPVIVRQMSDDAAVILMVDSNLQREHILPSERALAYKMKLDAMRRTSGRPSKENVSQIGTQKRSDQIMAEELGESRNQIQRFIRLTNLIPELLDMVDEKKIAFNPAVELSYLDESQQRDFLEAIQHIEGLYTEVEVETPDIADAENEKHILPADPDVKNFSYTVVDGEVYYRENSVMTQVELSDTAKGRVTGMVELRQIVNELIDQQLNDYPDADIKATQEKLNTAYDAFSAKYGLLNDRKNGRLFEQDSSYYLLCSLENLDEQGQLKSKAAMFTKRTIRPECTVTNVDTPTEALAVSIGERGRVDLPYMAELLGTPGDYERITSELSGVIFKDPGADPTDPEAGWRMADEYLSGNVRAKLRMAQLAAETNPEFAVNVTALEKAQPKDLEASEIDVRLGATWLAPEIIQKFMAETFQIPYYLRHAVKVRYSPYTAEWRIEGKSAMGRGDIISSETYGTSRANAYKILEDTLNLKDVRIYDAIEDEEGKLKRILNKTDTMLAQQKQQVIKDAFANWIWKDPQRRIALVKQYNELFNSSRPREYDGSHIHLVGMNPEITLREHQRNAIAHVLYGGNTLLAHEVGAGKTFEMAASAMEAKRLGLCQKSLFVVPNHLTEQWASEFLHLYPNAKLLVARKKDFETANRKKFCARIATGDYDAVIIGHSQFERIPLSYERQERIIQEQIDETLAAIEELKANAGENFSIKQMEKTRKTLETKLEKLRSDARKDDVITFEQLGVDRLFVDEQELQDQLQMLRKELKEMQRRILVMLEILGESA